MRPIVMEVPFFQMILCLAENGLYDVTGPARSDPHRSIRPPIVVAGRFLLLPFQQPIYLMMKSLIVFLFLALATAGCNPGGPVSATGDAVIGKVDPDGKLRQEKGDDDAAKKKSFIVRMGGADAGRGDTACLPVEATGFNNIVGFQFTMRFDSAALQFQRVQAVNLPGYSPSNFGTRFAERGYLSTLWSDPTLNGQTRPANTKLFEVCFLNLMKKGEETDVKFQDGPTTFEVIQADMSELRFLYANGTVRSR